MSAIRSAGARTPRWKSALAIAVLAVVSLALLPGAANAHKLKLGTAKALRNVAAQRLASDLDGLGITKAGLPGVLQVDHALVGSCTRRSAHKFTCPIGADGTTAFADGTSEQFLCQSLFTARLSGKTVKGTWTDPSCGPAPAFARHGSDYAGTGSGGSVSRAAP